MSAVNWAKLNTIILAQENLNEELQERLSMVEGRLDKLEKPKKASKKKVGKKEEETAND